MRFKPINGRVIVREMDPPPSLIILLDHQGSAKYEVVDVSDDCQYLKPNDMVLLDKHHLMELKIPGIGDIKTYQEGSEYAVIRLDRPQVLSARG